MALGKAIVMVSSGDLHAWEPREESPLLIKKSSDAASIVSVEQGQISEDELKDGERLMYADYTTIDWLRDLVKDSARARLIRLNSKYSLRYKILHHWDACSGWIAAGLIGIFTAIAASIVDVVVATVFDWKEGYCSGSWYSDKDNCHIKSHSTWIPWTEALGGTEFGTGYLVYAFVAALLALSASLVTLTTAHQLPSAVKGESKKIYTAAGSGIPEIKTILCGFVIKGFLSMKTLIVKCIGCVGATGSGMCLAKEGPFVHLSACVSWQVGGLFEKYRINERKRRELLAAGTAAGLSVAFGAPIGGVLFAMEEISSFFPPRVLWRSFFCSLLAATTLRMLNPSGTGRLTMFQIEYDSESSWEAKELLVFAGLGVAGGVFGGIFCRMNYLWARWFRSFKIIKQSPVLEVFLIVCATSLLQYPNIYTRVSGDKLIGDMLETEKELEPWILASGTLIKLVLTTITFGIKVPSGIIIPSLDAGAMFGRLVAYLLDSPRAGSFAIVGAAAFLGGVSRMTISLCVIMIELTGSLEYAVPTMLAILVSKWVADAISKEGVYDLAQNIMGHPFLHVDGMVVDEELTARDLCPPTKTMDEITVEVDRTGNVQVDVLREKLMLLLRRGLLDAGLVLTTDGVLKGYIAEAELSQCLASIPSTFVGQVRILSTAASNDIAMYDISKYVDATPMRVHQDTPIEIVHEMFAKLGLRMLCVVHEGRLLGVIIKKRLLQFMQH
ncbi:putative Voltage-gated chloride channel [Taphrina deformans PYCC 5710]|uniref:Chloride channel protein n=1 Tax=Taphrina deformans (strain PYCC 5710 / ATCC 11124 / CBS 356.35 / IMI 108563 / JCM 9778 / NBRC 8474) TaxID=1097556 RepID=R4XBW0_TAPDE|nr:putative Voltage-gated chloride channel [Taphrina deformans PYCC 5710]|eukprot:CCG83289.1 putative Voltage-gated chloride channel [Taphrina deformans PYCC 5710]